MADIFSAAKRSEIMSRIRSSGTKPEVRLHTLIREYLGTGVGLISMQRTFPAAPMS
jgi:G:T-mismatch repair DNA endonuclease (very short patch repair protein)